MVEARGGDTFTNAPDSSEPDNPAFVLPERSAREPVAAYVRRINEAAERLTRFEPDEKPLEPPNRARLTPAAAARSGGRETRPPPHPRRAALHALPELHVQQVAVGREEASRSSPGGTRKALNSSGKTSCSPT